jgi:hypothetical protein
VLDDRGWKAKAAVADCSHRRALRPSSDQSNLANLTMPSCRIIVPWPQRRRDTDADGRDAEKSNGRHCEELSAPHKTYPHAIFCKTILLTRAREIESKFSATRGNALRFHEPRCLQAVKSPVRYSRKMLRFERLVTGCVRPVPATALHGPWVLECPARASPYRVKNYARHDHHGWRVPHYSWNRTRVAANRAG